MAALVNRRIWPNAFVCLQKVHRLSKADRAVRSKINTYHPDRQPALHIMPVIIESMIAMEKRCHTHLV